MVATAGEADAQVTCLVMSMTIPSEYVPAAVNCWVSPTGTFGLAGVTAIEITTARGDGQHGRAADAAECGADCRGAHSQRQLPGPATARLLEMKAAEDAEAQVTWVVTSCVELSEYVPVAVNCWVNPTGRLGLAGVTAIETTHGGRDGQHGRAGDAAERGADGRGADNNSGCHAPRRCRYSRWWRRRLCAEAQVTSVVRTCVELSEYVPVAVNCSSQSRRDAGVGRRHGERLERNGADNQHG